MRLTAQSVEKILKTEYLEDQATEKRFSKWTKIFNHVERKGQWVLAKEDVSLYEQRQRCISGDFCNYCLMCHWEYDFGWTLCDHDEGIKAETSRSWDDETCERDGFDDLMDDLISAFLT